jgi:O-antigen/teichoic acid export membrane protein
LAFGFVASVLIARTLGPTDFGVFAVLGAIGNIAGAIVDPGLTGAAVRGIAAAWPDQPDVARNRASVFLWLRVAAALVAVTLVAALANPLARVLLGSEDRDSVLVLALLGVAATATSGALGALLQATSHFARLGMVLLANSVLTALLAIGLAAVGWLNLVSALAVLGIGTSLVSAAVALLLLPIDARPGYPSWSSLRVEGSSFLRFGRWLWLGDSLAMLASQLDVLLVQWLIGPGVVGPYALALNLAAKVDVVNHSLYTVLLPAASSLRDAASVQQYVRRGLLRSAWITLALIPAFPIAAPFIAFFYGVDFAQSVGLFQAMLGVAIFDVWTTPLLLLAFPADRPRLLAAADTVRVGVLVLAGRALIPTIGPRGAVIARLASKVGGAALVLLALRRLSTGVK